MGSLFSLHVALGVPHLFSQGSSTLVVTGSSQVISGASSLFTGEGLLPRCNVLEGSYLILAGESSTALAGGVLALLLGSPSL